MLKRGLATVWSVLTHFPASQDIYLWRHIFWQYFSVCFTLNNLSNDVFRDDLPHFSIQSSGNTFWGCQISRTWLLWIPKSNKNFVLLTGKYNMIICPYGSFTFCMYSRFTYFIYYVPFYRIHKKNHENFNALHNFNSTNRFVLLIARKVSTLDWWFTSCFCTASRNKFIETLTEKLYYHFIVRRIKSSG